MNSVSLYNQITKHPDYYYSESTNSFNSKSYKSTAGNEYHFELRVVEGIITKVEVGIGYKYTFINRIQVFEIKTKKLLGTLDFHNQRYYPDFIIDQTVVMLTKVLSSRTSDSRSLQSKEVLPQIFQIVNKAFTSDQRALTQQTSIKSLVA